MVSKENLRSISWVEKYRPTTVNEVIGGVGEVIKPYLKDINSIPNFLFISKNPGTGKTSLSKAIINDLECDNLLLNASDDRTLEVIRDKIKYFCQSTSTNGLRKCVFLDEFDGMLKASQEALRNLMETYTSNTFFILTCNNESKVIDPIKSRCVSLLFNRPSKESIVERVKQICINESLDYSEEGVSKLVNTYYPSVRNMINVLQSLSVNNSSVTPDNITNPDDNYELLFQKIIKGDYLFVRNKIIEDNVDVEYFNSWLFKRMLLGDISVVKQVKVIQVLAGNEKSFVMGADKMIVFISGLISLIKELKE